MKQSQQITLGLIRALVKDSSEVIAQELWKSWNNVLAFQDKESRRDERQKVLELLDEMSKYDWGDLTNYESHEVGVPKGYKRAIAELQAKLNQLKETK